MHSVQLWKENEAYCIDHKGLRPESAILVISLTAHTTQTRRLSLGFLHVLIPFKSYLVGFR